MHDLFARRVTPPAVLFSGCRSCSLKDKCLPERPGEAAASFSVLQNVDCEGLTDSTATEYALHHNARAHGLQGWRDGRRAGGAGDKLRVPIHTLSGIVCFGQVSCSPFLMGLVRNAEWRCRFSLNMEDFLRGYRVRCPGTCCCGDSSTGHGRRGACCGNGAGGGVGKGVELPDGAAARGDGNAANAMARWTGSAALRLKRILEDVGQRSGWTHTRTRRRRRPYVLRGFRSSDSGRQGTSFFAGGAGGRRSII